PVEGVFFCSARRRHTRWPRDWSSDVCASDLEPSCTYLNEPLALSVSVPCAGCVATMAVIGSLSASESFCRSPGAATFSVPACARSEEHTSELQSRGHLVCRLLLEKKKIITTR